MISTLSTTEISAVAGGHDAYQVMNAEYVGQINGNGGHWDMYQRSDGCLIAIWSAH